MTLLSGVAPQAFGHRVADFEREVELGGGEGFRAVFEHPFGFRILGAQLLDELDGRHGHVDHLRLAHAEDDLAEGLRGGVVDMHDGAARALERFEGAPDQVLARLGEDLDGHVVGNVLFVDQLAHEVEIGLRGRRERRPRFP
jgi:hypothetical protein